MFSLLNTVNRKSVYMYADNGDVRYYVTLGEIRYTKNKDGVKVNKDNVLFETDNARLLYEYISMKG